jgi:hypothetical protein
VVAENSESREALLDALAFIQQHFEHGLIAGSDWRY